MRICLICYHRNAEKNYPPHWIEQFKQSVLNQTYKEFDIFEVEYGNGDFRIFEDSDYESKEFPTFVHAMNYLIDKAIKQGYDYIGNLNCDDHYATNRIEKQLEFMNKDYDIISSNFSLIRDEQIIHTHHFNTLDIARELSFNNNVLCHPVIMYKVEFFKQNRYVPEQVPTEDLQLWQRAIKNGNSFIILPDVLCYHRLHSNSVCQNENNR